MKQSFLIVAGNETLHNDILDRDFIRTTFREVSVDANGDPKFLGNGRPCYASRLSGTRLENVGKQFATDDVVEGKIMTFDTTEFSIGENKVKSTTCVVFAGENPIEVANASLKRNGVQVASVLKADGTPTIVIQPKLVTEETQD